MGIYDTFYTDEALEKNGTWVDVGGGVRFLIARIGTAGCEYDKLLRVKTKPYRRQIENETIDPDTVRAITTKTFAATSVLDWDNVKDNNGNNIPLTKDNAVKLLMDLPDLADILIAFARDFQNYRKALLEEDAKNFENSSSGN